MATHTHRHTCDERQQNGCYKDEQKEMNVIRQLFMRLLVGRLFHFHAHIAIYIYIYIYLLFICFGIHMYRAQFSVCICQRGVCATLFADCL